MGNVCDLNNECLQHTSTRQSYRSRSVYDRKDNFGLKNLIQIKKSRITAQYDLQEVLGNGSFGSVYRAVHKTSQVVRAVKRIEMKKKSIQSLQEFLILKRLDHPNIIRIYDIFADRNFIFIVMDLCEGGELFDRIIKKGNLTENEARFYMKQLLSAIQHCHANNIMHRDLKPENIMFLNDKARDIKLIDFGVSTTYEKDKKTTLRVGSIYYMAPEVIQKRYNQKCDVWSLGVIMYILLTGMPPFIAETDQQIMSLILQGVVPFPEQKWKNISLSAKDLVTKMLLMDPTLRISAKEALNHPWIKLESKKGNEKLYVGNELNSIKKFCQMNQFQSALVVYISHNFVQSKLMNDLELKFKMIDVNGDGKISWRQFLQCYRQNMPPMPQSEIFTIFNKLDKNKSGFIDYTQFITSSIDQNYINSENLAERAFQLIDRDNDGSLNKKELIAAFGGCNRAAYMDILKEFDLNNDGQISKYEFKMAMKGFLKK